MFAVRMEPSDPHRFYGLEAIEWCDRLGIERDSIVTFVRSRHERLSLDFAQRFESDFRKSRCAMFKYDVADLTADDVVSVVISDGPEVQLRDDLSESRLTELIEARLSRLAAGSAEYSEDKAE